MATSLWKRGHQPDYAIIASIFLLTVFGLVMLSSASSELGKIRFNDTYYFLKRQVLYGLLPGLLLFFLASKIYYRHYQRVAIFFLIGSLILLGLLYTSFGYTVGGAGRWLRLGPLTFQPSEIMKLTFIIYLAAWLSNPKSSREKSFFEGFVPFLIVTGLVAFLLIRQPATSTVFILLTAGLAVYFLSGARITYVALSVLLGIASLALLIFLTPYRLDRIVGFFNYEKNLEGSGYHLAEALTTLGTGRLWGVGYGESVTKASRLPASISDSIFAVIGSELGFVGAAALVVIFGFLALRIFWMAKNYRDRFGRLLLVGFGMIIALQAFINMAAISGLLPLTGVPLPFISQGGTALTVFLAMSGIIVNISKYAS